MGLLYPGRGSPSLFGTPGQYRDFTSNPFQFLPIRPAKRALKKQVPNPLFDLAGIMCGQFGIPFWEFFLATLIGKAIIKTHIQTVFIISVCNNQLLEWIENELIWVLGLIPGLPSVLPNLIAKLIKMKEKYLTAPVPAPPNVKAKAWDGLSLNSVWNSVVWLMLLNFFVKIVTSTAQRHLRKQQEAELVALTQQPAETGHSKGGR